MALSIRTVAVLIIAIGLILFFSGKFPKKAKRFMMRRPLRQIVNGKRENFNELEEDFKAVKSDKVNMEAVVPTGKNLFEAVRLFESLAKNSGGSSSITFGDPMAKDGSFEEVPFHITASGNIEFLKNI